ncbi:MAG: bifunctional nuclease family protein [bacterium JZ-2024 1]
MRVWGVQPTVDGDSVILLLEELYGDRILPIFIGQFEGTSIDMVLRGIKPQRPFPYDLMLKVMENLGAELVEIVVKDLRENTFYAELLLQHNGKELVLDSRPSDAVALALRAHSPIYAAEKVLVEAGISKSKLQREEEKFATGKEEKEMSPEEEKKRFQKFLESLHPDAFKKWMEEEEGEGGEEEK